MITPAAVSVSGATLALLLSCSDVPAPVLAADPCDSCKIAGADTTADTLPTCRPWPVCHDPRPDFVPGVNP